MSKINAVTMPKWGIEMEEGTITAWLKEPGSMVNKGDDLIDVETSKIVNTVEAPYSGNLSRLVAEEGQTLPVGALLAVLTEGDVDDASIDQFISEFKAVDASFSQEDDAADKQGNSAPASSPEASATSAATVRVAPPVRRLAERLGVDLSLIDAQGGRITRQMVEAAANGQPTSRAVSGQSAESELTGTGDSTAIAERIPLSNRRRTIAQRLLEAKQQIPHYYLSSRQSAGKLVALRDKLKQSGDAVSLNSLLVYLTARALIEHPDVNACLVDDTIEQHRHADIAIAVATDDGLVAPVLHQADTLDLSETHTRLQALAEATRNNQLERANLEGGSFTISNLGMYGIDEFQAIINPPQGAILAVGAVNDEGKLSLNLSCDHRFIDGATGAAFLSTLKGLIENPEELLG